MTHINAITEKELYAQNVDGSFPCLLQIYNPDISWTEEEIAAYGQEDCYLRLVSDDRKVVYKGKTYLPCAFSYTMPESDGNKIGNSTISISALDERVRYLLRSIRLSSELTTIAAFLKISKNNNSYVYKFIPMNSATFELTTASKTKTTATFNVIFDKSLNKNVPFGIATQDRVPATSGK